MTKMTMVSGRLWSGLVLVMLVVAALWTQVTMVHAQSGLATVTGEVWLDANDNGERDEMEPLLAEQPVTLVSRGDGLPGVMTVLVYSDADGRFTFPNVGFGDYTLRTESGQAREITVSLERSTASVILPVAGQRVFLPVVGR
ncbi:MAG: hypothetical protein R2873_29525 [Caldilineaceae bacterium]